MVQTIPELIASQAFFLSVAKHLPKRVKIIKLEMNTILREEMRKNDWCHQNFKTNLLNRYKAFILMKIHHCDEHLPL